jgi:hypothetical protein
MIFSPRSVSLIPTQRCLQMLQFCSGRPGGKVNMIVPAVSPKRPAGKF